DSDERRDPGADLRRRRRLRTRRAHLAGATAGARTAAGVAATDLDRDQRGLAADRDAAAGRCDGGGRRTEATAHGPVGRRGAGGRDGGGRGLGGRLIRRRRRRRGGGADRRGRRGRGGRGWGERDRG